MRTDPPGRLLQRLVAGPTFVSHVLWSDRLDSTNAEVSRRAGRGAAEGLLVLADEQTAGRGRLGRAWRAPPGTSLMGSLLLRPSAAVNDVALLPLLLGLTLVEASETLVPGTQLSLKWPNDLLVEDHKCAGILVEAPATGVVVAGFGVNVDWRTVERPPELAAATSLSEVSGGRVNRWRLLSQLIDRLDRRYRRWQADPRRFLPAYRERCATLGQPVRVEHLDGRESFGTAVRVTDEGALVIDIDGVPMTVRAGDVHHLRHR
ncbi:MAG TPA: biotin--[acetyl-CoA-carboxylase] ligase [Euzebyales bacterium]|nr:biotin--[acetyl-CoA-carboxylase] ligase [Euzebyales bacterium]